jgi:hypothetical protein
MSICPVDELSEPTFFLNYGKRALGRREREIEEREKESGLGTVYFPTLAHLGH